MGKFVNFKPGFLIMCGATLIGIIFGDFSTPFFWATVLYCMVILNRRTDIMKEKIKNDCKVAGDAPEILDNIVKECFEEYYTLKLGFKGNESLSEEQEQDLVRGITDLVPTRMSAAVQTNLCTYYNAEALDDIISKRIYLYVMNFAIGSHMPIEPEKPLPNYSANGDIIQEENIFQGFREEI